MNDCSPEIKPRTEIAVRNVVECRPVFNSGKADASRVETSTCTVRTAGVGVQASKEGFAEIASGRCRSQQGLTATCKDLPHKACKPRRWEGTGLAHECVVAMTVGQCPSRRCEHLPVDGNAGDGRRNSGHLAVPDRPWTLSQDSPILRGERVSTQTTGYRGVIGVSRNVSGLMGRRRRDKPRSEPDRGNLAVRDRRGACGNVAMGVGLRPKAKALDQPPNPKVHAPQFYPDRCWLADLR